MINRLIGVLTLKAPVYKEIAHDQTANGQAAIVAIIAAIIAGVGGYFAATAAVGMLSGIAGAEGAQAMAAAQPSFVGSVLQGIISTLLGWVLGSWLLAFVAKTFFKGETNFGEMLRVTGYTRAFGFVQILGFIPCLGSVIALVAAVLGIVGNVIGIREAAGFDTTKAILSAIIAGVIAFGIAALIGGVVGGALGMGSAMVPAVQ